MATVKTNTTNELLTVITKMSIAQQKELLEVAQKMVGNTEPKAEYKKATVEPKKAKSEPKNKPQIRTVGVVEQCKNHVRYVEGQWVGKKVMYAINMQMKSFGAKFDGQTKVWVFPTEEDATKFMDAQADYAKKSAK